MYCISGLWPFSSLSSITWGQNIKKLKEILKCSKSKVLYHIAAIKSHPFFLVIHENIQLSQYVFATQRVNINFVTSYFIFENKNYLYTVFSLRPAQKLVDWWWCQGEYYIYYAQNWNEIFASCVLFFFLTLPLSVWFWQPLVNIYCYHFQNCRRY